MTKHETYFNYIDCIELPLDVVNDCSHSGDCTQDVKDCLELPEIKEQFSEIDKEQLKKELYDYGAWSDEELNDHDDNLMRILWIASSNIQEELI